jgi:apolipoprotein N-acyltransferase
LAGLMHAALMMLAAPPLNVWPAVFVALLPLCWLVTRPYTRPWRDALLVSLGVLPMWGVWEWWTAEVTGVGYVPFICLQASYAGLFLLVSRRLNRKWPRAPLSLLLPAVWTAIELFRGEIVLDGYAWGLLAHPLIAVTALAAPAALLGTYFVSFLAAAVNGAIAQAVLLRQRRPALIVLACCAVAWTVGAVALPRIDPAAPQLRTAIVQTNVPQSNKTGRGPDQELEAWKDLQTLTFAADTDPTSKPDVIIWPETMVPGPTIEPEAIAVLRDNDIYFPSQESPERKIFAWVFADSLNQLQKDVNVPMVVGAIASVGLHLKKDEQRRVRLDARETYNSVYLINGGKVQPVRYDKVRLTPFGETMPYVRLWPWLQKQMLRFGANGMTFDLNFGKQFTVFNVPAASLGRDVRIVTPVCFEITIAGHCRRLVFDHGQRRADLIASVTNDGWFSGTDIARLQHLQIARWRCLELATPMARAANTGISALVDARGRILDKGVQGKQQGSRTDGILMGQVPLGTATTLYARVGDLFAWATFTAAGLALIASFYRRKTSPKAEQKGQP